MPRNLRFRILRHQKHAEQLGGFGSTWTNQNTLFLNLPVDQLLAITAYGEAASEGAEGMMAVLNVIKNRTKENQFYDSEIYNLTRSAYHAVILKPKQFSMFNIGNAVRPIAERMANNFYSEVSSNSTLAQAYQLAQMLVSGQLADNTGNSQYYHATYVSPSWASSYALMGQIGQHLFYSTNPQQASVQQTSVQWTAEEIPTVPIEAGLGGGFGNILIVGIAMGLIGLMIFRR